MTKEHPQAKAPRGTRQFLVHLDADVIRRIKILAIDRGVSASSLVREALGVFLDLAEAPSNDPAPGDTP